MLLYNTMKINEFLKAALAKQVSSKWKTEYLIPDTYRLNLEEQAGVAPLMLICKEGFNLIYQFEDGKAMIVATHSTGNAIRGATIFVARK